MRRVLLFVSVFFAGAFLGVVLWTEERRADDERECAIGGVPYPTQGGCDVVALWWTLGLGAIVGALAIGAVVWSTKGNRIQSF